MKKKLLLLIVIVFYFLSNVGGQELTVIAEKHTICSGDTIQISAQLSEVTIHSARYKWTNLSKEDNIDNINSGDIHVWPSKNELDTFYVTADIEYWEGSVIKNITLTGKVGIGVTPKPDPFAGEDKKVCFMEPYEFEDAFINDQHEKRWRTINGKGNFDDATKESPIYFPDNSDLGTIIFEFTGYNGVCDSVSDKVEITFVPVPTAIINLNDTSICSHESLDIPGFVDEDAATFEWEHNGDGTLINANTLNPTYVPEYDEKDTVTIKLHALTDGCNSYDELKLNIKPMPVEALPDTIICEGDIVVLGYNPTAESYLWGGGQTSSYLNVQPSFTKEYTIEIDNYGCTFKDTVLVEVIPSPVIGEIVLDAENQRIVTNPSNGLWNYIFMSSHTDTLQHSSINYFDYSNYNEKLDTVYVIAYNIENGCSNNEDDLFSNFIVIPPLEKVNAFSPNGDGINDLLMPGRKTTVFDRTSKILYEGWDGWDGRYNGKEMPEGTYFYVMYDDDGNIFYKGPVTILR